MGFSFPINTYLLPFTPVIPFLSWMASKYSLPLLFQRIWQVCLPDLIKGLFLKIGYPQRPISSGRTTKRRRQETRVTGSGLDHRTFKMGLILLTGLEEGTWTIWFPMGGKIKCSWFV